MIQRSMLPVLDVVLLLIACGLLCAAVSAGLILSTVSVGLVPSYGPKVFMCAHASSVDSLPLKLPFVSPGCENGMHSLHVESVCSNAEKCLCEHPSVQAQSHGQ